MRIKQPLSLDLFLSFRAATFAAGLRRKVRAVNFGSCPIDP